VRLHEAHVERAHDGRDDLCVASGEEVVKEAPMDLHLEGPGVRSPEFPLEVGGVYRLHLGARLVELVEGIVALAEGPEHELVRPLQHPAHRVLEEEDRAALIAVEQRDELLE